ncbi:MAG: DUF5724 domain-containing protein, partial [Oscillospiraceae bacterium]
ENELIRYSSVKRAFGTWLGIIADADEGRTSDLERISRKSAELVNSCLNDSVIREECLSSEDSMKIYIALWAKGFFEVRDMLDGIRMLSETGSHHQLLTAGYAALNLCDDELRHEIAKSVVSAHYSEQDVMAVYLPCFMPGVDRYINHVVYGVPVSGGYSCTDVKEDYTKRRYCDLSRYFDSNEEGERFYDILMSIFRGIKGKSAEYSPCIFPWNTAVLEKGELVMRLAFLASALHDNDKIDEVAAHFGDIGGDHGYYDRRRVIILLLTQPETDKQKRILAEEVCDKAENAREAAFKIIDNTDIPRESYLFLESSLRYKNAQIRANIIKLLCRQKDDELSETITRLIYDKKEEKRTAALDIIIQLSEDESRRELFERVRHLAAVTESTTTKERILIERINPVCSEAVEKPPIYDADASYGPVISEEYLEECKRTFDEYFYSGNDFDAVIEKLAAFMTEHDSDEFISAFDGETVTLGAHSIFKTSYEIDGKRTMDIPFRELWEDFYRREIKSPVMLFRMYIALLSEGDFNEFSRECVKILTDIIGKPLAEGGEYPRRILLLDVCDYLMKTHRDIAALKRIAVYFGYKLCSSCDSFMLPTDKPYSLISCHQVKALLSPLSYLISENFAPEFAVKYMLNEKKGYKAPRLYDRKFYYYGLNEPGLYPECYIRAAFLGVISEDFMYKTFFEKREELYYREYCFLDEALEFVSLIYSGIREYNAPISSRGGCDSNQAVNRLKSFIWKDDPEQFTDTDKKLLEFTEKVYRTLTEEVLSTELSRGDTMTKYSGAVMHLKRIYGADKLAAILSALGSETLERSEYYCYSREAEVSKKQSLSHLLAVCVPLPDDNADTLRKAVNDTDITEKRLIEAAMYSPEWLDIIEEYLGWDGLKSACCYFIAHMKESFDDRRKAVIAKYTPLTPDELNAGAFDIDWFRSAYDTLGEKRFNMVYDAAKYISDGAKHSRARKYADAVLGRLDAEETRKIVADKRNKDLLMAYALIPILGEEDICERYLYLQQFLKESKKFGSQRSASEKRAVETAMQNLALNAGYADVTRLTLRMETKLIDDSRELFEEKVIDDVKVRLFVSVDGKADIICEKGDKALKSVPAKLKKNEYILRLGEAKKKLNEQYRRTRTMFEQAMEDGTEFTVSELAVLGN